MIIDSHVHVDEVEPLGWFDPPDAVLQVLDEAGVDQAAIITYTDAPAFNADAIEYIASAVRRYPDRFVGYARVHPWYDQAVSLLRDAVEQYGFKGLKLHPVSTLSHPADDATVALLHEASRLGVPVLYHCGDEPFTTPLELELSASACPAATIIFGHMGGYFHVQDAIDVAHRRDNVYLETSAMPYPRMIRNAVDAIGAERVIFGSDGPGCDPRLELYKIKCADLSTIESNLILSGNILRLWANGR